MAFIKNSTYKLVEGEIPIIEKWVERPMMIHTATADIHHTDNHKRYHVEVLGWESYWLCVFC